MSLGNADTVARIESARVPTRTTRIAAPVTATSDSDAWLSALRAGGAVYSQAVDSLHALLVRAARFEVGRRRASLAYVRGDELDDIALQAADDALVAVLAKLDQFRGASRFTTWAYKFAVLEAGVRLRRRARQHREVALDSQSWTQLAQTAPGPDVDAERAELLAALSECMSETVAGKSTCLVLALPPSGEPGITPCSSTVGKLIQYADCPVLVVPPGCQIRMRPYHGWRRVDRSRPPVL